MTNTLLTPEEFARDVLDTIKQVAEEEGVDERKLTKAFALSWQTSPIGGAFPFHVSDAVPNDVAYFIECKDHERKVVGIITGLDKL